MNRYFIIFILLLSLLHHRALTQPYGLTSRQNNSSLLITTSGGNYSNIELEQIFKSIALDDPILVTHAGDRSDRIFIVEKKGRIKIVEHNYTTTTFKTFLDIRSKVTSSENEAGLLGLVFHPNYSENGKFYIHYNYSSLHSRISEMQVSGDPNAANPASERELLTIRQPYNNHNGGMIAFGPDNYLYISFGDGGSGGDPHGNGQNRKTWLGKILRIDVDHQDSGLQYAIPADNPLVGNNSGYKEEIWAWGLRNPWRFSFDRVSGTLWCADVGQGLYEEIDIIVKGGNYGWNIMEGLHCYNASSCNQAGLILPIQEYSHSTGKSITGGYVYHGPGLPALAGLYLYGDYVTRKIWSLKYVNGSVVANDLLTDCPSPISSFGEDEAGEVYVVGYDGKIYRFKEKSGSTPPGNVPGTIATSGLYSNIITKTIAAGIIPYAVQSQLWSDGAYKQRFLALPGTEQLEFSPENSYGYPANSVLVKNFALEMEKGNPASRKLIETRFLVKRPTGNMWDGFSYLWNDSETDATLLTGSRNKTFTIIDAAAPGGNFQQTYHYPSRDECLVCHVPASGYVLGFTTRQLNRNYNYNGVTDNQLRSLNHVQLFTTDIGEDYSAFTTLKDHLDESAELSARARSYLDANCAYCHQPNSSGRTNMDLRFTTSLADMNIVDELPSLGDLGVTSPMRVKPGVPTESVLYLRMLDTGENRMPQIATSIVDEQGAAVIVAWITSLHSEPVPVRLGSFTARYNGDAVLIQWETSMEISCYGYALEKFDGRDFRRIFFIPGKEQNKNNSYSYRDLELQPGVMQYRLLQINTDGTFHYSAEISVNIQSPAENRLLPNYPNPFNSGTIIRYELARQENVTISIYNILGVRIALLLNESRDTGFYKQYWNGADDTGRAIPSGLYFIEMRAGDYAVRIKTMLVR
ncbi:MAG TPA: PQQ-dependent sugar dehydrogenase [bacterium]|nr:PQQ-dependent sugar dehydrogenase [bacterium]HPN44049.1 PQQ-dependent sugar dehydrogenase [bacterium]